MRRIEVIVNDFGGMHTPFVEALTKAKKAATFIERCREGMASNVIDRLLSPKNLSGQSEILMGSVESYPGEASEDDCQSPSVQGS
jgi:hypothetical protein